MKSKLSYSPIGIPLPLMALILSIHAHATDISTVPLSTYFAPSSVDVKPNILFVLDDSGSMDWAFMPDQADWYDWDDRSKSYVRGTYHPVNYVDPTGKGLVPDYLVKNPDFNGLAYNPAIRYRPPIKYNANNTLDTTTYPSMTGTSTTGGNSSASNSSPNWKSVKKDGYGIQSTSTSDLSGGVFAYVTLPGEYCDKPDLRTCNTQSASNDAYPYAARLRWCTTANLTTCRATYDDGNNRYPRMPAPRVAKITFSGSTSTKVTQISVGSLNLMSAATSSYTDPASLASSVASKINACSTAPSGNCNTVGYSATVSGAEVSIYAPDASSSTPGVTTSPTGGMTVTSTAFARSTTPLPYWRDTSVSPNASTDTIPGENIRYTITPTINSYAFPGLATKSSARDDCAGTTCTYAEEMTNYANWYAYYRTRMQLMKTAASHAFSKIDSAKDLASGISRYRVGFMSINNAAGEQFLNVNEFSGAQRANWFTKLFAAKPGSGTPLREALANAGRIYGGKLNGQSFYGVTVDDPIQWSCQQNFTLLSTDGYWNGNDGFKLDGSTAVGNQDGAMPPPYNDGGSTQNQQRTSSLQARTQTQTAQQGILQTRTTQLSTRTSQLQKRTYSQLQKRSGSSCSGAGVCSWGSWTDVASTGSCTWDTSGTTQVQCRYNGSNWSAWANEASSCTPAAIGTATSNNTVWKPGVECQYTTWSDWNGTNSCAALPQDKTSPWNVPIARECQTTSGTWTNTSSACTPTSINASGVTTQCQYIWTPINTPTCSPAYVSGNYSNPTVYNNCATSTGSWTNVSSCTITTEWSASGTKTACQYGAWSSWSNVSSCEAVQQSSGPEYTVATAKECKSLVSGGYSDTLADVAAYYYNTDLRRPSTDAVASTDVTGTCTGPTIAPKTTANDLCNNNVPANDRDVASWQHMTTFTLGLGATGKMLFSPTYWTDTRGDFFSVKTQATASPSTGICPWGTSGNTCVWPQPGDTIPANIDDLWHAAVNGRGSYFSAKDPATLTEGLSNTLKAISQTPRPGTAAAASSSNPNVSAGDNYIFSSYYKTVDWYGNLYRQRYDTTAKRLSSYIDWSAQAMLDCATTPWTPSYAYVAGAVYRKDTACRLVTSDYVSGATFGTTDTANTALVSDAPANCSLNWAADTAYGIGATYSYGGVCRYVVKAYRSGTAFGATDKESTNAAYVSSAPTTRTIYTKGASGLVSFEWTSLTPAQQDYFIKPHIAYDYSVTPTTGLTQFCSPAGGSCLSTSAQNNSTIATGGAAGEALVNFLRGDRTYESTYFRERKHVLGDIVSSEARYVQGSLYSYTDANHAAFKALTNARQGAVYVASNDGMLHAFNAETGHELWAYIPEFVFPDIYKLADKEYKNNHQFFVDGTPETGDICPNAPSSTCTATQWKTILVGGLNRGGKGYYALDITDPAHPALLWEFTDANMGYTFGNPRIVKLKTGRWVVLLTAGYNNADGLGHLYVVDAYTGALIRDIQTTAGTPAAPSGLARIAPRVTTNNVVRAVYGGDMLGNLWRFDVNGDIGVSGYEAHRLVTFTDSSNVPQPITAKPVVTSIDSKAVVYVGTGSYLGITDISNTQSQTMYAIKDPCSDDGKTCSTTSYSSPRTDSTGFIKQVLIDALCTTEGSCTPGRPIRKVNTSNPVNWANAKGWYVDFPTAGERANTDPSLMLGSLVFTTNTPNNASVEPCGEKSSDNSSSWLYTLDYRTGGAVEGAGGVAAVSLGNTISTRPVLIRTSDGTVIALIRVTNPSGSTGGNSGGTDSTGGPGFFPGLKEDSDSKEEEITINKNSGETRRVSWREISTE